jgi:hypothetical protein
MVLGDAAAAVATVGARLVAVAETVIAETPTIELLVASIVAVPAAAGEV